MKEISTCSTACSLSKETNFYLSGKIAAEICSKRSVRNRVFFTYFL